MNKTFMTFGICGLLALTGCGNQDAARDIYEESGNTINVNNERAEIYNRNNKKDKDGAFGYVRHQKNPIAGENNSEHYKALDREQLADTISKLSSDLPDVNDVATLVTDEEVLVAYQTDSKDRELTADQVKLTAMSVVPRFYHVYVTDNKNLIKNVENFATLTSNSRNVDANLDRLIVQMLKSPQGRRINKAENENGVMEYELDESPTRDESSPKNIEQLHNR